MKRYAVALLLPCVLFGRKFYDDDPLQREPAPISVKQAAPRKLSDYFDLFSHLFGSPGERNKPGSLTPAKNVNTLGEVMDGAWYVNRHYRQRLTVADLVKGPGEGNAPSESGAWTVLSAKSEGITPGFLIEDARGVAYFIKFDPKTNPEIASAADVIGSKLFHALGYHVPENYIVGFDRSRLKVSPKATIRDPRGIKRTLTSRDIDEILLKTHRDSDGRHRASASRLIPGQLLHSFRYYGTRTDDPNDTIPHEHRRELRGLQVFCAWLNHDDSRAVNSLDSLVEEGGLRYVKHFLIDFGSILGSASNGPNSPRSGFEQFFTWKSSAKEFLSLGLYVPGWARINYPDWTAVGRFTAKEFNPAKWTPEYPNPAFENRLPDDIFWAARQVVAFSDEEIRAVVRTGRYSDPAVEKYVADTIIARRNAIGRAYLARPLAIDSFALRNGRLEFNDLAAAHGYLKPQQYTYRWFAFDNDSEQRTELPGASTQELPGSSAKFLAVDIGSGDYKERVTVYVKLGGREGTIVGVDRAWN